MLNGFGTVINALGKRAKPYLPQICGTIKWRLNNKAAKVRAVGGRWRLAL
jgi:splicing factor 3B subunit 1